MIHQTAIIHPNANIGENVSIGPYSIIGENVEIGKNSKIDSHVCIDGITKVGEGVEIFPFASIGKRCQDLKYKGEPSTISIGDNTVIREYVTIHAGTADGIMKTVVGENCLIMISCHIAHDCIVGNNVIMSNGASLAGHVQVGDNAIIGGMSGVHQFTRIGSNAMIGGGSMVTSDIIPYGNASGNRASLNGINIIGLKRRSVDKKDIVLINKAFDKLFKESELSFDEKIKMVENEFSNQTQVMEIINFLKSDSSRSICMPG